MLLGCGSDAGGDSVSDADRQRLIDELVDDAGVEPANAECAIDGQIEEFGARILDTDVGPTDAEVDRLFEIWQGCGLIPE